MLFEYNDHAAIFFTTVHEPYRNNLIQLEKSEYHLERSEFPLDISDYHLEISEIHMTNLNIIWKGLKSLWIFSEFDLKKV